MQLQHYKFHAAAVSMVCHTQTHRSTQTRSTQTHRWFKDAFAEDKAMLCINCNFFPYAMFNP